MQTVFQVDRWNCQLVLLGSCAVLELSCNQERMSVELIPIDSPYEQAHALIQRPGCALVARY